jgi:DNA polymerase-4
MKCENPTYLARDICDTAMQLLHSSWNVSRPVRMITVTGASLVNENSVVEQLSLFDDGREKREKEEKLAKTLDALSARFGADVFRKSKN